MRGQAGPPLDPRFGASVKTAGPLGRTRPKAPSPTSHRVSPRHGTPRLEPPAFPAQASLLGSQQPAGKASELTGAPRSWDPGSAPPRKQRLWGSWRLCPIFPTFCPGKSHSKGQGRTGAALQNRQVWPNYPDWGLGRAHPDFCPPGPTSVAHGPVSARARSHRLLLWSYPRSPPALRGSPEKVHRSFSAPDESSRSGKQTSDSQGIREV